MILKNGACHQSNLRTDSVLMTAKIAITEWSFRSKNKLNARNDQLVLIGDLHFAKHLVNLGRKHVEGGSFVGEICREILRFYCTGEQANIRYIEISGHDGDLEFETKDMKKDERFTP